MDRLRELFTQMLTRELKQIILSSTTDPDRGTKVRIRPVLIRGEVVFQETLYRGNQVFHHNCAGEEMAERLTEYMDSLFRQAQLTASGEEAVALISKKGRITIKRKKRVTEDARTQNASSLSHDRSKRYILREGEPVDFLVHLGVQLPDGRVVKAKYDKFRQINRYLEFIEDILERLPADREIRIVDFGCGKSYLTFGMYYYLHQLQGRNIRVTGLDLKADVIRHCNELAEKLHYDALDFREGDISSFQEEGTVDMVVSLHACDKATDYALEKAVKWGASVILAVPCCQHELNGQIRCDLLQPVLKYGIIRERIAALVTDALRADLLEENGYETQILEFIDMEHTPKNLMIRAVRKKGMRPRTRAGGEDGSGAAHVMEFLHVNPVLKELL